MTTITFGTDGWRGVVAEDFTFANVRVCAQAVMDYLREKGLSSRGLIVGYDTRFASDRFAEAVAEVAAANEVPVALCSSPCPTPVASYAVVDRRAGGGVIITASHNPSEWNGFKFKPDYGGSASPEVTAALEARIRDLQAGAGPVARTPMAEAEASRAVERFDPAPAYLEQLGRLVDLRRLRDAGLRIVVDSMYGAGRGWFRRILEGGRTQVIELRDEINPAFPGMHNPEPIAMNLGPLREAVRRHHAHLGLATDGDADRIGVVDERGDFVNQLRTYALLLFYLLEVRGQRGPAIRSVTSTILADRLGERYGIPVHEAPVGFKYIGPMMMETGAILGGEESGGFGFGGHIPERDAPVAGLFLLDLLVARGKPLSQILEDVFAQVGPSFYDRLDVHFSPRDRGAIEERVHAASPGRIDGLAVTATNEIDGKKFILHDGSWLLIRFSGTEPLLRIYTERPAPEHVQRLLAAGRDLAGV